MGWVIFNSKRCDNAKSCPTIKRCSEVMGVENGKGAIYFDESDGKIKVNEQKCHSFDCVQKPCIQDCADCFSYAETETELWWAKEQINKAADDEMFSIKDRYNSGFVTPYAKLDYREAKEYISQLKHLCVLEITCELGCCSAHDSMVISDLLTREVYENYYKKVVVYNEEEVIQIEKDFDINELPVLLFFYNGKKIGKITGIYRNSDLMAHTILKDKIELLLRPYISNE